MYDGDDDDEDDELLNNSLHKIHLVDLIQCLCYIKVFTLFVIELSLGLHH